MKENFWDVWGFRYVAERWNGEDGVTVVDLYEAFKARLEGERRMYRIEVPEEYRRGYFWKPTESKWDSRDMALYYALTQLKGREGHDWRIAECTADEAAVVQR
jgi:hypothetical protein